MPKRKLDPLPAAAFQIMLALSDGELHGYAIMREVEE
jgi:DNA-binding PadR family transcriptional regulator